MIDADLNPWLIEVNMSPAMDYSTSITKRMVKQVLHDTAKLIHSPSKGSTAGGFTCIYRGNEDLSQYDIFNI